MEHLRRYSPLGAIWQLDHSVDSETTWLAILFTQTTLLHVRQQVYPRTRNTLSSHFDWDHTGDHSLFATVTGVPFTSFESPSSSETWLSFAVSFNQCAIRVVIIVSTVDWIHTTLQLSPIWPWQEKMIVTLRLVWLVARFQCYNTSTVVWNTCFVIYQCWYGSEHNFVALVTVCRLLYSR